MSVIARDPARVGAFTVGHMRLGVYRPTWEQRIIQLGRPVIWRVANLNVDRDTTTGHRVPTYAVTHSIYAVVEERGGSLMPLPAGFVQRGNAIAHVLDGVRPLDQMLFPESHRLYEVQYVQPVYERVGDDVSFCYRTCDLHYLEFYQEI